MTPHRITERMFFVTLIVIGFSLIATPVFAQEEADAMKVVEGKDVSIEYTLRLEDKSVVDSNVGSDPLVYRQGNKQIVPGLESELAGMAVGESKKVTVVPKEGYGEVNPEAFLEVEKKQIPPDALKVGAVVVGKDRDGRPLRPRVSKIKENTVLLDFNHPLAGKTLVFDVKVVAVKTP